MARLGAVLLFALFLASCVPSAARSVPTPTPPAQPTGPRDLPPELVARQFPPLPGGSPSPLAPLIALVVLVGAVAGIGWLVYRLVGIWMKKGRRPRRNG